MGTTDFVAGAVFHAFHVWTLKTERERERESHFFEINSRLWTTKPPIDRLLRGLRARSSASWGISGYSESGKDDWDAWMVFDLLAEVVCAAKF